VLDLVDNLGVSPMFNVEDLTLHRGTFEPPRLRFGASVGTEVARLSTYPQSHIDIEAALMMSLCHPLVVVSSLLGTVVWPPTMRFHLDYRR